MANPVCEVLVTETRLKTSHYDVDLGPPEAGAVVDFWGIIRGSEDGREINGIEYEANLEMAEHQLRRIAQQAIAKFALELIVIHHRIGFIAAGQSSLYMRVASQHRAEAFRASEWVVDELKRKVPIWKRPKFKIDNQPARAGKGDRQAETHLISRG
jgi:molybdopterin synthase catalytic subunit